VQPHVEPRAAGIRLEASMATTGVSVEQFRSQLLSMAQAPDPYPFLTIVEEYLAVVPLDEQMRALAVGALIQKGLYRVAIELAAACPSQSVQANELRTATQRLSQLPSDQLHWSTCDARFSEWVPGWRMST